MLDKTSKIKVIYTPEQRPRSKNLYQSQWLGVTDISDSLKG